MSLLNRKYFKDEKAAFAHLESLLWADGVVCPHCGVVDQAGRLNGVKDKKGRSRPGLWKCYACRKQFTAKVGTVFESAHIPLHKMLQAVHLMCSSKKGISAHQLHRTLEVDYKSAWFLAHRIREAMRKGSLAPMGGGGKVVEVDETWIGRIPGMPKPRRGFTHKNLVLTLVERGGEARSFHVAGKAISDIMPIIRENVAKESRMNTDEAKHYYDLKKEYLEHKTVNHSLEEYAWRTGDYVDGKPYIVTTNTVEGYYSIFKRGMKGVYQHCSEKHLHRYLAEFDFRYSNRVALGVNDDARTDRALTGIVGKRLTYRRTNVAAAD